MARSLAAVGSPRAVHGERPPPAVGPLPGAVRTHLDQMTGRFGIYQHARGRFPDPGLGYCTDDVARAAIVDVLHGRQLGLPAIAESLARNVQFLAESVAPRSDRLRNFRDDDGNWLERQGSADAHARGVQALGVITGDSTDSQTTRAATEVLDGILPVALELDGLRPWAHVVLGCVAAAAGKRTPASARIVLVDLAGRLFDAFEATEPGWPWHAKRSPGLRPRTRSAWRLSTTNTVSASSSRSRKTLR